MNKNEEAEHDCVAVLRLPGPGCSHGSRRSSDITPATGLHWALGASYGHLAGHRPATPEHHTELNLDLLNIVLYKCKRTLHQQPKSSATTFIK